MTCTVTPAVGMAARRGDLAIVECVHTSTDSAYRRTEWTTYDLGVVVSAPGGFVAKVREYPAGRPVTLPGNRRRVHVLARSKYDAQAFLAAWNSDRFTVTLRTLDDVRGYVQQFRVTR